MNGTNEPIKLAAMSRYELVKLIRKQEQQVNTLTEALIKIREHESNKSIFHPGINVFNTADEALQSLESPREEQTP